MEVHVHGGYWTMHRCHKGHQSLTPRLVSRKKIFMESHDGDDNRGSDVDGNEHNVGTVGNNDVLDSVDVIPNSLCMNCGGSGTTRMLIHKIPYFREIIVASFACEWSPDDDADADGDDVYGCGYTNNEVTFGGEIQLQGCAYEIECRDRTDLNRQLIKSDSASVRIPALDFEIPPGTQKGGISTIEGFLSKAASNLSMLQSDRMEQMPEVGARVADIITSITLMSIGEILPFSIVVDDPAGNSFIENPHAPAKDPNMRTSYYNRTPQQDEDLGLNPSSAGMQYKNENDAKGIENLIAGGFGLPDEPDSERLGRSEVIRIPQDCPSCKYPGESLTAVTDIPHFKEVIIMAFNCAGCGYRTTDIKGGGAVPTFGTEVDLLVESFEDMKRDVLKSDSAMVTIPEIDLELQHGTLGGVYTTVEGLMSKILKNLKDNNPFMVGDSSTKHHSEDSGVIDTKNKMDDFFERLREISEGRKFPFHIVIRDPLGNSFVSTRIGSSIPPEMDPNMKMHDFRRSWQENEDFGLNDMNTKDFETGVEIDEDQVMLPDRLTHVVPKGEDHPTIFAMGCDDPSNTLAKGVVFPRRDDNITSEVQTGQGPDWFAVRTEFEDNLGDGEQLMGRREFSDDSARDFEAREEFGGYREGYIYRMGSKGLGYYEDSNKPEFRSVSELMLNQ